ncbi:sigma 54-interacting transcriptional regulator [Sporolituus thermophilus]|uniref:HTH-type transcriptional regulatory protein TyrR n=1 Tax=Sporolituus thermophilus DSM 23256 TaxID=1123285 RepID=A0A1G7K4Y8_9FIRM|nr:sigma 54-interacting transcriptional regulator [Sporolituus thermophilus]SDF32257.1 PAS domain S-box-containing protein [Sporolituus thermophilus DSM 23256]
MLVKELAWQFRPFLCVDMDTDAALKVFAQVPYAALPVVGKNNTYLGIVRLRDLIGQNAAALEGYIVKTVLLGEDDELDEALLAAFEDILVVGNKQRGCLRGFIAKNDILKFLAAENKELRQAKMLANEFEAIFESSYDGLYICDHNARIIRVNSSWERICGFSREEVRGRTPYELVAAGLYSNSAAIEAITKKQSCTVMLEITQGPKKGTKIMATGTPVLGDNGQIRLVVVNVRDITVLMKLKEELKTTVEIKKRYEDEIRRQQLASHDIVAQSPTMQRILELASRVAQVDSTVLITGESGVGKEVVASKIHYLSSRCDKPLIKINCGAIPENLLESELFGYQGGAFTGAKREGKPGMFELAASGTLFLDEIGELPVNLQVKLLRAIQDKEITRVGGVKPIPVDVRIIAATNRDLAMMVKKGEFRDDLFYRLNVINIEIPPLRERREDLPALLHFFLQKFNRKHGKTKALAPEVVEQLMRYDWPGNVREVENIIERLIVLVNEPIIEMRHLPDFLQDELRCPAQAVKLNTIVPWRQAISQLERQLICRAMAKYGTTRKAAQALGVNQSTIVRKLKEYRTTLSDDSVHQHDAWEHRVHI